VPPTALGRSPRPSGSVPKVVVVSSHHACSSLVGAALDGGLQAHNTLNCWEQSSSCKTDGAASASAVREGANFTFDIQARYPANLDHARSCLRLPCLLPRQLLLSSRLRLLLEP